MGGTKRKIKIEKIEKSNVKSVTFTKRRNGLFCKASELYLLSPETQIAIIATPHSSNSHASFYSFGHSSVDHIVSSLLHDLSPLPNTNKSENRSSGLGFWWKDERFDRSENLDELKNATHSITRMLNDARLQLDAVRSKQGDGIHKEEEVLQFCYTNTNNNEETSRNQIVKFEGASGSGSKSLLEIEKDALHIDDFFNDVKIDPF